VGPLQKFGGAAVRADRPDFARAILIADECNTLTILGPGRARRRDMFEKGQLDGLTAAILLLVDICLYRARTHREGQPPAVGREAGLAIVRSAGSDLADFRFSTV